MKFEKKYIECWILHINIQLGIHVTLARVSQPGLLGLYLYSPHYTIDPQLSEVAQAFERCFYTLHASSTFHHAAAVCALHSREQCKKAKRLGRLRAEVTCRENI